MCVCVRVYSCVCTFYCVCAFVCLRNCLSNDFRESEEKDGGRCRRVEEVRERGTERDLYLMNI